MAKCLFIYIIYEYKFMFWPSDKVPKTSRVFHHPVVELLFIYNNIDVVLHTLYYMDWCVYCIHTHTPTHTVCRVENYPVNKRKLFEKRSWEFRFSLFLFHSFLFSYSRGKSNITRPEVNDSMARTFIVLNICQIVCGYL